MADALLTSLCAICHVSAPRYKCPRCSMQTCSVTCVRRHKARSACSGERDATAFVPRSRLRSVAGVNHDYNFLHGIDLSVERAERVLVGDRGLVGAGELRPPTAQLVRWQTGRDGRRRRVLVTREKRRPEPRRFERMLDQRLRRLNVDVVAAPAGMARRTENRTTFNRRTGGVNWQVEWLRLGHGAPPTRTLAKVLEDVPLYQAYPATHEERQRAERGLPLRPQRSGRAQEAQRPSDATWNHGADSAQDPSTGAWLSYYGPAVGEFCPREDDEARRRRFQFFLGGPPTGSHAPTRVTALGAGDCLRDMLANTRVREFPTLYVLEAGERLPPGFVLGPKDTAAPRPGMKRKGEPAAGGGGAAKRRKHEAEELEEGEVGSEEGEVVSDGEGDGSEHEGGEDVELSDEGWSEDEDDDNDGDSSSSTSGTSGESD